MLTRPRVFAILLCGLGAVLSWIYADRSMPIPDEGALLTAAVKVLHGGVFYRDVDAYAFPGMTYLLAGAMGLFGEHLAVARALAGAVFCATLLGVYACALALIDRRRAALCALSLLPLKFIAFPIYTMFFYADAAVASALFALALFLRHEFGGPTRALFAAGLLTGLSVVTKQSTGLLVAIVFVIVLAWPGFARCVRHGRTRGAELASYGAGLCVVLGTMSLYFAVNGAFGDMLRGGLLRPFSGYLPTSGISFLPPLAWWNFGDLSQHGPTYFAQLYFELVLYWSRLDPGSLDAYFAFGELFSRLFYSAIPLAFGGCGWLWIRSFRRSDHEEQSEAPASPATGRFFAAAGVALAISLSALPRADFVHVATIYPAVILVLFALVHPGRFGRGAPNPNVESAAHGHRRTIAEAVAVLLVLASTAWLGVRYDGLLTHRITLERAAIWVKPQHAWLESLVRYVETEIPEGEPLFVYGHEAHWYFLTNRYSPRAFSQLYPGMTSDESGQSLAALIARTRPRVILQGVLHWPGMPDVRRYTGEVSRALNALYAPASDAVHRPPRTQMLRVWRLRDAQVLSP